jgi:hypothetical protein
MNKKREEPEKEYDEGTTKLEQYQRRGQRLENRIKYCQQGNYKRQNQPSYPPGTGRVLHTLSLINRAKRKNFQKGTDYIVPKYKLQKIRKFDNTCHYFENMVKYGIISSNGQERIYGQLYGSAVY